MARPQTRPGAAYAGQGTSIGSVETKTRINEQNILNAQKKVQLLSRNFLDLKKELREKVDLVFQKNHEMEKSVKKLTAAVERLEKKLPKYAKSEDVKAVQKFHESVNVFKPELSKEEAGSILDDILKKAEANK